MTEKQNDGAGGKPEFRMQKMYLKDLSFENPNSPQIYQVKHKQEPKLEVNLQLKNTQIDKDHWEVALEVTAKVSTRDEESKVLFILEVEHAAIFLLKNIPEEHVPTLLGVDCPTLLFPFTRQIVSQVSMDGGFVPFLMEPVNFVALFQNALKRKAEENQ